MQENYLQRKPLHGNILGKAENRREKKFLRGLRESRGQSRLADMRESVDTRGSGEGEAAQVDWRGKGGRGSASSFPKHDNPKQLTNDYPRLPPLSLLALSKVSPSDDTLRQWVSDLRRRLGTVGLRALGVPAPVVLKGKVPCSPARRVVFYLWSSLFCPSNLSSAFHLATWGRFNAEMPKDYREAAERILARKTGPRRARLAGKPYKPFVKPWHGKTPRRKIYVVPPLLPLL